MALLVKADLLNYIDLSTLNQLTDGTDAYITDAIKDAEARITERISQRIDTAAEYVKAGAARDRSLLKHAISITIYYLFERLYTDVLPEGRVEAYKMAEAWLEDINEGKITVALTKKDESTQKGWPVRWGSEPKKGSANY